MVRSQRRWPSAFCHRTFDVRRLHHPEAVPGVIGKQPADPTISGRTDRRNDCDQIVQFGHVCTSDALQFDDSVCRTLSFMMSSPNPSRQAMSRRRSCDPQAARGCPASHLHSGGSLSPARSAACHLRLRTGTSSNDSALIFPVCFLATITFLTAST
jgi:hypothetical protein